MKNITCPFCMKEHPIKENECPEKKVAIPANYKDLVKKGKPVVFILTIGYTGHGKTVYLSSLFYTLRYVLPKAWNGFSSIALRMDTLSKIYDYVKALSQGQVPPLTPVMFPTPLISKFQQMPLKANVLKRLTGNSLSKDEAIFVFYDIGGETFNMEERIRQNLPIIQNIDPLIFLIDLPSLYEDHGNVSADDEMQKLLNTIYLSLDGDSKRKGIIVCFTKADLMWGKTEQYGPLAQRPQLPFPKRDNLQKYMQHLEQYNKETKKFIKDAFPGFYHALDNNFKEICFTSFSSLGSNPSGDQISMLDPASVIDPLLWTLKLEGHL